MLSLGTQQKLAAVLVTISEGETKLEMCRQNLSELPDYVPYSSFRRLDRSNLGYLTLQDLNNFFISVNIPISQSDLQLILKNINQSQTTKIIFDEFKDQFTPRKHQQLLAQVLSRTVYSVPAQQFLQPEIELAMCRVMEQIARCQREYDSVRQELVSCADFSIQAAFQLIDNNQQGWVDTKKIGQFLCSKGKPLLQKEIQMLMMFADVNQDQKLSYKEFSDMMIVGAPSPVMIPVKGRLNEMNSIAMGVSSPKTLAQSVNFYEEKPKSPLAQAMQSPGGSRVLNKYQNEQQQKAEDNLKYSSYVDQKLQSPLAQSSISQSIIQSRITNTNYEQPTSPGGQRVASKYQVEQYQKVEDNIKYSQYLEQKEAVKRSQSPVQSPLQSGFFSSQMQQIQASKGMGVTANLPQMDEEHLMGMMKMMIGYDRDLQNLKTTLSYKNDFNLLDAFRLFDTNQNQQISKIELEQGLNKLGIFPTSHEIMLFFQTYDRDLDNFLQFGEFSQVFYTPNQNQVDLLNSRKPTFSDKATEAVFCFETRLAFKSLLLKLLETEVIFDNFKEQLIRRPQFNLYNAFQSLDLTKDGAISYEDLKQILGTYGIYTTENDMVNMFKRFDRNQDGKIHYSEFVQEMSPRRANLK